MNKITCEDLFSDVIFDFDDKNPITAFCNSLSNTDFNDMNTHLRKILDNDKDYFALDYIVNRYDRNMSPLYLRINDHYNNLVSTNVKIARIIKMKFLFGWNKLAEAMFSDYNPVDNYNMIENRSTLLEETTNTENEEKVVNKYSGFNSDEMSDVSESDTEGSIDTTKTTTGGKVNNELTRRGNIGVTTSQQMIESEYNLRKKNLLNLIYHDIDTILFIDYYS